MAAPIASPAPIHESKQKRKRRPTRTPKPSLPCSGSGSKSRLISPSPYLNRSFQRKKLLFNQQYDSSENENENENESEIEQSPFDLSDLNSLNNSSIIYDDEYKDNKRGTTSDELLSDILNLSINGATNTNNNSFNNSFNNPLLRNARSSIKINKNFEPYTPQIHCNTQSKIMKKKSIKTIPNNNKSNIEIISENVNKQKPKQTTVRITKSHRVFKKYHKFGKLLVAPLECGSGCPLYCSFWKDNVPTVTKLMPMFENEEFSQEENVDNALREYELHVETYRKGCKLYGMNECPIVDIFACVDIKHFDNKKYLAYVMPALHCNLAQFVSKYRKLNINEAHKLLKCGLKFLKICNESYIIHNDIKPENIFLDCKFDKYGNIFINKFVFGDFGCAATTLEEFPFGNLTGTITMWDSEALGEKHGDEDGFYKENDLYGFIGCLLDGIYGGSIMEELLEEENENWEDTEWSEYTQLIRICRKTMTSVKFMEQELNHMKCYDPVLRNVLKEIGKSRDERMNLEQILLLVG